MVYNLLQIRNSSLEYKSLKKHQEPIAKPIHFPLKADENSILKVKF